MDKSKLLEGLKKIKEAFQSAQKFVDAKLNDGTTIIRYDAEKLDIGVPVMAVTEQGAIAIPDGDYTLEDGTMFTIVEGKVSAVKPMDMPEEGMMPAAASQSTSQPSAPTQPVKSIVESVIREQRFAEQIEELKTELAELKKQKENFASQKTDPDKKITDLENEISSHKKTIQSMFELLEKIGGEPAAQPAEPVKKFDIKAWRKEFKNDLQNIEKQ